MIHRCIVLVGLTLVFGLAGCQEEGPMEAAGRNIDEAVEDVRDEGALERLGREVDEAVDETKDAAREVGEAAQEATR